MPEKKKKLPKKAAIKKSKKSSAKKIVRKRKTAVFDVPVVAQETGGSLILAQVENTPTPTIAFIRDPHARVHAFLNSLVLVSCTTVYVVAFALAAVSAFAADPDKAPDAVPPAAAPPPAQAAPAPPAPPPADQPQQPPSPAAQPATPPGKTTAELQAVLDKAAADLAAAKATQVPLDKKVSEMVVTLNGIKADKTKGENSEEYKNLYKEYSDKYSDFAAANRVLQGAQKDYDDALTAAKSDPNVKVPVVPVDPPPAPATSQAKNCVDGTTASDGDCSAHGGEKPAAVAGPAASAAPATQLAPPGTIGSLLTTAGGIAYGGAPRPIGAIAAQVLEVLFGFLGIIFACLLFWGGMLWMTAEGDEEKVKKSLNLIKQSLIGLIITLASLSATYFVLNKLLNVVQGKL